MLAQKFQSEQATRKTATSRKCQRCDSWQQRANRGSSGVCIRSDPYEIEILSIPIMGGTRASLTLAMVDSLARRRTSLFLSPLLNSVFKQKLDLFVQ